MTCLLCRKFFWSFVRAISHQDKAVCYQRLDITERVHSVTEVSAMMYQWVLRRSEAGLGSRTKEENV